MQPWESRERASKNYGLVQVFPAFTRSSRRVEGNQAGEAPRIATLEQRVEQSASNQSAIRHFWKQLEVEMKIILQFRLVKESTWTKLVASKHAALFFSMHAYETRGRGKRKYTCEF